MFRKFVYSLLCLSLLFQNLILVEAETETQVIEVNAQNEAQGINVQYHTIDEIRTYVSENGSKNLPRAYATEPDTENPPYAPGSLTDEYLEDGLKAVNTMRYIAGLDPVTLDSSYNAMCQAGTLINAVNNVMTHTPSKPEGMDDELYQLGYQGTSSSNIAAGYSNLASAVINGWMEDGDAGNISRVGHRRWVLHASMKKTGFGHVKGMSAMYAFDNVWGSSDYTDNVWPAQNMPVEYFGSVYPWSVSTGSSEDISSVTVKMTKESDGTVYTFSNNSADGYFNVENSNYGNRGAIIWRPTDVTYEAGDVYHVEISGLSSGTISYTVNFFNIFTEEETMTFNETDLEMHVGETKTVYPIFEPAGINDSLARASMSFTSPRPVEMSMTTGSITIDAVAEGTAVITGYSANGLSASVRIRVTKTPAVPTAITLTPESASIETGKTVQLTATVTPADADQTVTYTSSNPGIASVSSSGLVTGISAGSAVITATTSNGLSAECEVTVTEPHVHTYGEPVYTWSDDFLSVTASAKCTGCDETVTETVNTEYSIIKEAGCEEDGTGKYTAVFTNALFETQEKTVVIEATGHDYKLSTWEWAEDYSSAKAVFVCANDESHTEKVNASVTSVRTEPTCAAEGSIVYTATVTFEGNTYTDTKSVVLEKTDHVYGEPVYTWAADFSTVTAKAVCTVCGDEVTETVNTTYEVIKAATAEEDGTGRYTAVFTNEMFETQTKDITLPATGHTYGTPEYTWSEDNKTVTAVVKCMDCDREITETVDTVYEVIKAPGCEEKGTGRYSAYFANELFTTQTKDVEIDAIGHNYGEPEYTWAVDFKTVTAKAVCENCGDEITETVETTYEVIREATLEETGTGKYTAVFTNEMFETQTKEVEIPALSDKSPKEIHIDQSELSILCNASVKLNAEVLPEDAEDKTVTWSSSDESVAIVGANGTVRGIKPGKVTITATTVNGLTDTCEIRVLFTDVAIRSRYYYTPVYWAFDRNITVGYGGVDLFSPDYSVTRGQFVTFLYRLAGEPEVTEDSGFDDVDPAKFYAKSIAWAAANGITTGYAGRNEFGPDDKCTREQIVTFLWRYAESPKPEKAVNFTDSRPNAYYLDALSWAAEKEITVGLNDGTGRFGVGMNCTRGMTVTFLYRFDQNK